MVRLVRFGLSTNSQQQEEDLNPQECNFSRLRDTMSRHIQLFVHWMYKRSKTRFSNARFPGIPDSRLSDCQYLRCQILDVTLQLQPRLGLKIATTVSVTNAILVTSDGLILFYSADALYSDDAHLLEVVFLYPPWKAILHCPACSLA